MDKWLLELEVIIENHLLPLYDKMPDVTWHRWRTENMYTVEVNDVFEENLDTIRSFYKKVCKQNSLNTMSREIAEEIFVFDRDLQLNTAKAKQAFGLSKMTVPYENEDGPKEYE